MTSDSKVAPFPVRPAVNEEAVSLLQEYLDLAKKGGIESVMVVAAKGPDHYAAWCNMADRVTLIGYLNRLVHVVNREMDADVVAYFEPPSA